MIKNHKLLYITAIPPIPLDSGGATRVNNTIKELNKNFILDVISVAADTGDKKLINFLQKNSHSHYLIKLNSTYCPYSFLSDGQPYWLQPWLNNELPSLVNRLNVLNQYDCIMVDFTQMLYLTPYLPKKPIKIFTAHDITTVSFLRRLIENYKIKSILGNLLSLLEVFLYEKKHIKKYDLVITMSDHDKNLIKKLFSLKKIISVSNGISVINQKKIEKVKKKELKIGYFGSFNHPPNKMSFIYFLNRIAPILNSYHVNYKFYIAGNNSQEMVDKIIYQQNCNFLENKLINLGVVNKSEDFFEKIDLLVAPIFSGSGTRIKILEAAGNGVHTITTKLGAEGLPFIENKDLITLAKKPQEFASAIIDFIDHPKLSSKNKELKNLLWEKIFADLSEKIIKIIQ